MTGIVQILVIFTLIEKKNLTKSLLYNRKGVIILNMFFGIPLLAGKVCKSDLSVLLSIWVGVWN